MHNSNDISFAEAWTLWLVYREHSPRPFRASTLADYQSIYRRHLAPALASTPLGDLDGLTIARLCIALSSSGLSNKRLSNVLVPLRACLRWHHKRGLLATDPSPWFDPPAPAAEERRILSATQIEALIAELPLHYRPHIAFAAYTGVRAGELRAITWNDVELTRRVVRIDKAYYRRQLQASTKTGHSRVVPLPVHIAEMLRLWESHCPPSPQGLVFPSKTGRVLDLDTFRRRVFKPAAARAGLPQDLRFHDLRHTSASLYLQHGATLREVMEIHGWRQMQTAMRYLHVGDSLLVAADRLSEARAAALDDP